MSIYSKFISDTVDFLTTATQYVPTACLLTGFLLYKLKTFINNYVFMFLIHMFIIGIGVNLPDHKSLFDLLATNLEKSKTPVFVATLFSEHFTSIKSAVICMVSQILNTDDDKSDVILLICYFHYLVH